MLTNLFSEFLAELFEKIEKILENEKGKEKHVRYQDFCET